MSGHLPVTQTDMRAAPGTTAALVATLEPDVRAAVRGDREAFVRLVDRCSRTVCSIALAMVRDVQASEDIAQEVFLAAWSGLRTLRNPASFLPWIRQMTRFRARAWLRGHRGARAWKDVDPLLRVAADARPGAAEQLLAAEERRILFEVIDALPADAREVVTLYYREGQSVQQVAGLLGIREEAVKKRMSRARSRLSDALCARFGEVMRGTAPASAFTAVVMAALVAGAPASASAAGLGVAAKLAGGSLFGKLLLMLGSMGPGALLGWLGIEWEFRTGLRQAIDDEERQALDRARKSMIASMLAFCFGMLAVVHFNSQVLLVLNGMIFLGVAMFCLQVWQPRIVARRLALERERDPGAADRQRRQRLLRLLRVWLGFGIAAVTLVWAFFKLGAQQ